MLPGLMREDSPTFFGGVDDESLLLAGSAAFGPAEEDTGPVRATSKRWI